MNEKERVNTFLTELTALTRKHGIKISGCGCCGSPYLTGDDFRPLEDDYEHLDYDEDFCEYTIYHNDDKWES